MSTTSPGALDASTSSPYATDTAAPSAAVSPAVAQSAAAAASRRPHPATLTGTSMVMRTGATSGSIEDAGVSTPTARAAARKTAT